MTLRYAELQVTTNFSFLLGASHADDLVEQAKALGLSAIAVTDRNSLAGVVRAYVAAKPEEEKPGIRLVIGARLDLEDAPSLLVYPTDRAAYGRLCRLLSHGQLKADKGKCILHLADVAAHAEGQIFIALPPDDWDWREAVSSTSKPSEPKNQGAKIFPFVRERLDSSAPLPSTGRGRGWGVSDRCSPPPLTPPRKGEGNLHIPSPRSSRGEGQGEGPKDSTVNEAAPHPNPLPARGEREGQQPPFCNGHDIQSIPILPSEGEGNSVIPSPRSSRGEGQGEGPKDSTVNEAAPHPNPLPARGEREGQQPPFCNGHDIQSIPILPSEGEGNLHIPSPRSSRGEGQGEGPKDSTVNEAAPHPNPLPARGEREGQQPPFCDGHDIQSIPILPSEGDGNLHIPSPRSSRGEGQGEGPKDSTVNEAAPHPNPLPARGEREELEISLRRIRAAVVHAPVYLAASHTYRGDDRSRIAALAALGDRCGTPIVATNDVLYHHPDCRPLQDVVTCIREKTTLCEAGLRLEANAERYIKSPEEMAHLFRGHEAALARTLEIVEACRFSLSDLKYEYPDEPVPPGKTPQEHLVELTWRGAASHFSEGVPEKVRDTIEKELKLIGELKFAPYFLTVHDIVAFARSRDILCQGRGSAANSVVCYCLGITAVNPIEVDLLFERFISSARLEPPDIDVDFEHERREEVIQWIYNRYGRHRAGLTATVISYRSRSAVRDVGKVFGLSEDSIAALAGMVWGTHAGGVPPEQHVRGAGLDPTDRTLAAAMKLAQQLMGFPRHLSQHVGGFVLTRGPLVEVVPVGNAAMADRTFIEWDKDDIAALGLMKVDVLALGMLTCVRKAFDLIAQHHGRLLTLASLPRDDEETYDMLCRADSLGVFQVESRAQMNMLPRLKPRIFYDLVVEVAIVRPGPIQGDMVHPYLRRRAKVEEVVYPYPKGGDEGELKTILGKTLGVPLFQEQAMRLAMVAAEFTDKEVSDLRRAMATFRRVGTIGLLEEKMVSRMVARGYEREFAERCFSQIKGFGEYGFPESHAASFALLVYVSAWIKCRYPAAFACALLNSQPMGFYAPAQIVRDAREHGVEVREADVSFSAWYSTLEDNAEGRPALRLGLKLVDGLSEDDIEGLSCSLDFRSPRERGEGQGEGPFQSPSKQLPLTPTLSPCRVQMHGERGSLGTLSEFAARGRLRVPVLEKLAAADAFRSLGLDRRQALWEAKALANAPPLPLFSWSETQDAGKEADVQLPEMALSEHVVNDYQTLRLSLKEHPMAFLREDFRRERVLSCKDLRDVKNGAFVRVAGVVLVRQRPGAGNVVFMTIEDETGVTNAIIWPNMLERFRKVVMTSRLILIEGRIQNQVEEHANIIHVVSTKLIDRSDWLLRLSEWAADMDVPHANADEVLHAEPGSAHPSRKDDRRIHPRFSREPKPRHPRNVRIIPKSRDFH